MVLFGKYLPIDVFYSRPLLSHIVKIRPHQFIYRNSHDNRFFILSTLYDLIEEYIFLLNFIVHFNSFYFNFLKLYNYGVFIFISHEK